MLRSSYIKELQAKGIVLTDEEARRLSKGIHRPTIPAPDSPADVADLASGRRLQFDFNMSADLHQFVHMHLFGTGDSAESSLRDSGRWTRWSRCNQRS